MARTRTPGIRIDREDRRVIDKEHRSALAETIIGLYKTELIR